MDDVVSIGSSSSSSTVTSSSSSSSSSTSPSRSDDDDLSSIPDGGIDNVSSMPRGKENDESKAPKGANVPDDDGMYDLLDDSDDDENPDAGVVCPPSSSRWASDTDDVGIASNTTTGSKRTMTPPRGRGGDRDDECSAIVVVGRRKTTTANDNLFDALDDDDLAELEEDDSLNGDAGGIADMMMQDEEGHRPIRSNLLPREPARDVPAGPEGGDVVAVADAGAKAVPDNKDSAIRSRMLRDFTISYNCEVTERPMGEELLETSDDEAAGVDASDKENSSPTESKSIVSGYVKKHISGRGDRDIRLDLSYDEATSSRRSTSSSLATLREDSSRMDPHRRDVMLDSSDSDTTSSKRSRSSSLDTPRENSSCSSGTPSVSVTVNNAPLEGEGTVRTSTLETAVNPYKMKGRDVQSKGTGGNNQDESGHVDRNALPEVSNPTGADPSSTKSAHDSTTDVVSLPDLGLSPLAQLSELQHLDIDHSQYKPPSQKTCPDPIVHKLDAKNRPTHTRRSIAVDRVFSGPIKNLWKSKFASFNHVQSEMAHVLANSDDNVIVSAPTGAGKTALFEMAMARLFSGNSTGRHVRNDKLGKMVASVSKVRKVVYIAPNKALCEERQSDWSKRLVDIDPRIICTTITGDAKASSCYADIASAHLILTTPEKWDSITRRWNDQFVLLSSFKLVLIDEVHLIGEKERGGCLESVICRMKTIQRAACARKLTSSEIASSSYKSTSPEALVSKMRIVAVSATLPNLGHIAAFVESGEAYIFDQSYRPVPLNVYVQACGHIGNNRYLFDKSLKQHVPSILRRFSSGRPSIVFCHSKKETEELADELTKSYANPSDLNELALASYCGKTGNASLQKCICRGIAFHHAGLDPSDRRLVEEAFGSGSISCLAATSTLSMGVNLPSHLVVIKGTSAYRGACDGHQDIDTGTLLQMIGRAGRPGFDTSGTAVIMTDSLSKTRYENLSQGLKVIESHLMDNNKLTEVLNIEISQGVIVSAEEAVDWVKGTFLYRRILSNPLLYGFNGKGNDALHSFIHEMCKTCIDNLQKIRAISVYENGTFFPEAGCHVMSRNYIDFEAMKAIVKLPHDSGPVQLLRMMSNCAKIQIPIRRNEKKALNEAYKTIKYKLEGPQSKVRIQTDAEKCFVMLQAAIGQYFFGEFSLRQQMSYMIDGASQVLSAIEQYAKEGSRNGQVAIQAMLFRRSLYSSLWGEHDGVLNQIGGVTQDMAAKLKASGISSFADAMSRSNEDIVKAINVTDAFANSLRVAASTILHRTLNLSAGFNENDDDGGCELNVKLNRRVAGSIEEIHKKVVSYSLVIFTDRAGGLLHFSDDVSNPATLSLRLPEKETFGRVYIRLVSNLVGLDEQVSVEGRGEVQTSSFSLSPAALKGMRNQSHPSLQQATSGKKRPFFDAHRNSVLNISDVRLHKRGKDDKEPDDDCIIIDPEAVEYDEYESSKVSEERPRSKKTIVTPSPHPHTKNQNTKQSFPVSDTTSPLISRCENTTNSQSQFISRHSGRRSNTPSWQQNIGRTRKSARSDRSKWFQVKAQQKTAQQTAFNSPKENPFATYSFDPNDIENSLVSNADKSKHQIQQQSIIPSNVPLSGYSTERLQFQAFHTPGKAKRRSAASSQISSVGLLQQKATELQQFHSNQRRVQHNLLDASVHNHAVQHRLNDGRVKNQYDGQNRESDHFVNPATSTHRSSVHQHIGTSDGSVMQQSVGMAQESSRTPLPPFFMGRNFPVPIAPVHESHFHQHQGAPTGSVMQQSFDVGMTQPHFMGHGNVSTIARGNYYRGEVMSIATRPVSFSGHSIASRLREDNFGGTNVQACTMLPNYNRPIQSTYDSQLRNDCHLHVQRPEVGIPGFQEDMTHRHFEDTFNNHVCFGLDPAYGNAPSIVYELPPGNLSGVRSTQDYFFGDYTDGTHGNIFNGGSFGNMSGDATHFGGGHSSLLQNHNQHSVPQQQTTGHVALHHPYHHLEPLGQPALPSNPYKNTLQEPSFRDMSADTTHFGGGHATSHNHYQHSAPQQQMAAHVTLHNSYRHLDPRDQTTFPSNPYENSLQQSQNSHCLDNPPMQVVVVQNSSARSGLDGDDTSQFEDAFL